MSKIKALEETIDGYGMQIADLCIRRDEILMNNDKVRDGARGNVKGALCHLNSLIWRLESMQTHPFEMGEMDWMYLMRDVTRAIFNIECFDVLMDDLEGLPNESE
jgi:hypothetical protein